MIYAKKNPVALTTSATRVLDTLTLGSVDFIPTPEETAAQAALIIAARFRLDPVRSRLVCRLAGIGGVA